MKETYPTTNTAMVDTSHIDAIRLDLVAIAEALIFSHIKTFAFVSPEFFGLTNGCEVIEVYDRIRHVGSEPDQVKETLEWIFHKVYQWHQHSLTLEPIYKDGYPPYVYTIISGLSPSIYENNLPNCIGVLMDLSHILSILSGYIESNTITTIQPYTYTTDLPYSGEVYIGLNFGVASLYMDNEESSKIASRFIYVCNIDGKDYSSFIVPRTDNNLNKAWEWSKDHIEIILPIVKELSEKISTHN